MIETKGITELIQELREFGSICLASAARKGAKEVSKEIAKEYKRTAPKQTGLLRQSVTALSSRSYEKGVYKAAALVRRIKNVSLKKYNMPKYKNRRAKRKNQLLVYYAHLVEFGFLHTSGKRVEAKHTMQKARNSVEKKANVIVETKLYEEIKKRKF